LVSLDEAVIDRFHKGEDHFEVLVDPVAAEKLIEGKEVDILWSPAIDALLIDAKKGTYIPQDSLPKF
jgi:ribosome maturation protein Sdo1